jgi:hypothetical protein
MQATYAATCSVSSILLFQYAVNGTVLRVRLRFVISFHISMFYIYRHRLKFNIPWES